MAAGRGQEGLTCGVLRRAFPCQRRFSSPSAWRWERRAARAQEARSRARSAARPATCRAAAPPLPPRRRLASRPPPPGSGRPQLGGAAERHRGAGGRIRHQPPLAVDPARRRAGGRLDRVDNTGGQARLGDRRGGPAIEARRRVRAGLGPARRDERRGDAGRDGRGRRGACWATSSVARTTWPRPCTRCGNRSRIPPIRCGVADTLASLQAARSAMDAERAPGGAGPWQAEIVRGRLDAFESSLQALRADDQRYP